VTDDRAMRVIGPSSEVEMVAFLGDDLESDRFPAGASGVESPAETRDPRRAAGRIPEEIWCSAAFRPTASSTWRAHVAGAIGPR
jgi:hypothetical protein